MLKKTLDRYLEVRRAAGVDLKGDGSLLRDFARFATDRSEAYVRRQTAIDWAGKAPSPCQRERRLGMVRRFADHARAEDTAHETVWYLQATPHLMAAIADTCEAFIPGAKP